LDNNSSCKLIFLENKAPTPILKKNTKGKILYGVFPIPVNTGTNTVIKIIPPIKIKGALAFEIPFLDVRNKHTTNGNKNTTITPSYLNCDKTIANPSIILETSNNIMNLEVDIIFVKIRIEATAINTKYDDNNKIFFLLGKSNTGIIRIVIGKNITDNACEKNAGIKKIEEIGQLLKIKYIESR